LEKPKKKPLNGHQLKTSQIIKLGPHIDEKNEILNPKLDEIFG
jgi:hypothetical protein